MFFVFNEMTFSETYTFFEKRRIYVLESKHHHHHHNKHHGVINFTLFASNSFVFLDNWKFIKPIALCKLATVKLNFVFKIGKHTRRRKKKKKKQKERKKKVANGFCIRNSAL